MASDTDSVVPLLVSIDDVAVVEGDKRTTPARFVVTLSHAAAVGLDVAFTATDGTASAGQDYVARSGSLRFAAGTLREWLVVDVFGDKRVEGDEWFAVNLLETAATLSKRSGIAAIVNDDRHGR